jgi:fucose permease
MRGRIVLWVACFIFLALGIITAGVGPSLAALATNTGTTVGTVGILFTALFSGALLSQLVSGLLLERFSVRWIVVGALLLLGSGMFLVTVAQSIGVLFVIGLLAGLGHGCMDVTINLTIARFDLARSSANLNLINMFFGVGAVIGPAIIGLALRAGAAPQIGLWLGSAMMIGSIPLVARFFTPALGIQGPRLRVETRRESASGIGALYRSPLLWMLGILMLLGVGLEQGTGGWTSTFGKLSLGIGDDGGALLSSGYWLTFTAGRLLTTVVARRFTSAAVLRACLGGILLAGLILPIGIGNLPLTVLGTLLLGFFIGPLFPTAFAFLTDQFKDNSERAASVFTAMGSIGGLSLTAIQGALIEKISPFAGALYVTLISALLVIWFALIMRRTRAEQAIRTLDPGNLPVPAGD